MNFKGFKRAQRNYDAMEHPDYYDDGGSDVCECLAHDCEYCFGDDGQFKLLNYVRRVSHHTANKDHYKKGHTDYYGKINKPVLLVKKGEYYRYTYERKVYRDNGSGDIEASVYIGKMPVQKMIDKA
jgi:hypothetical protein